MTDALTTWLGERLLVGSLQGAAVVAVVWLVCRFNRRIPASTQAILWWLAGLKLALVFVPAPAIPIALLPADVEPHTDYVVTQSTTGIPSPLGPGAKTDRPAIATRVSNTMPPAPTRVTWLRAIVMAWIAMVLVAVGRLVYAHRLLRGIVRRSIVASADDITVLATRLGLARAPMVHVSDEITVPQVLGVWKPVVLVPADLMATLTPEERLMALCHELMHIRRRDIALGWVPAIAERLFFFHPLVRLSAREYVAARESACDVAVVNALGVPAADYGRLLVRLGIGRPATALAASGSPFSRSSLKRRLQMLQHHDSETLSRRWRVALVAAAAAILPFQLTGRAQAIDPLPPAPYDAPVLAVATPPAIPTLERPANVLPAAKPAPVITRQAEQAVDDLTRALETVVEQTARPVAPAAVLPSEYVIGPGDVLTLTVWQQKDHSGDLLVRPDGRITVPLIGDVDAAGLTPERLAARITQAVSKFLVEPRITIGVKSINSRKVSVTGGVVRPGQYDLLVPMRVLDVISMAGGLRQFTTGTKMVVIRSDGGKQISFNVNYKELLNGANLDQNLLLQPGDAVLVSE